MRRGAYPDWYIHVGEAFRNPSYLSLKFFLSFYKILWCWRLFILHMKRLFIYYCQDEIQENIGLLAVGKNMVSTRTTNNIEKKNENIFR